MSFSLPYTNAAGHVSARNGYVHLFFAAEPRPLKDFANLFVHAGQLLSERGWYRLLDARQQCTQPFTKAEHTWLKQYWNTGEVTRPAYLIQAIVLPPVAFTLLGSCKMWLLTEQTTTLLYSFSHTKQARTFLRSLPAEPLL